jgi:hypothetical protein
MTVAVTTGPLMPIALREPSRGWPSDHPLLPLKNVAKVYREEATARAESVGNIFHRVNSLFGRLHDFLDSKVPLADLECEKREGVFLEVVAPLSSDLLALKTHIAGLKFPDSLNGLARMSSALQPLTAEVSVAGEKSLFGQAYAQVCSELRSASAEITAAEERLRKLWLKGSDEFNSMIQAILVSCIRQAQDGASVGVSLLIQQRLEKSGLRKDTDPEDRIVYDKTLCAAGEMHQLISCREALIKKQHALECQGAEIMLSICNIIASHVDVVFDYESQREAFVDFLVKSAVQPHLDPRPKAERTQQRRVKLPEPLKQAARGVGLSKTGELVAVTPSGDVERFISTLVDALESRSDSFASGSVRGRSLSPVVRAALPIAKERVAQRAADREAEERLHARAAALQRELVGAFFDDELNSSVPSDPAQRSQLREKFMAMYADFSAAFARYERLGEVAGSLSIPPTPLQNQYECYLLSEKDLERWSKDVKQLRSILLKNFSKNIALVMDDVRNLLPSEIGKTLKEYSM